MQYYSQYGQSEFILVLATKRMSSRLFPELQADRKQRCVVSEFEEGRNLGERPPDWRISLVKYRDLEKHWTAVVQFVISSRDDEMFLATTVTGLRTRRCRQMIERFKASGKIGCFVAIPSHHPFTLQS